MTQTATLESVFGLMPMPISLAARAHLRTHKMACIEERHEEEKALDALAIETAAYMLINVYAWGPSSRSSVRARLCIGNTRLVDGLDYLLKVGGLELDPSNSTRMILGSSMTGLKKQDYMPEGLAIVMDEVARLKAKHKPTGEEIKLWRPNTVKREAFKRSKPIKTHCKYGHPITGKNLLVDRRGGRWCRTCKEINTMLQHGQLTEDPRVKGVSHD